MPSQSAKSTSKKPSAKAKSPPKASKPVRKKASVKKPKAVVAGTPMDLPIWQSNLDSSALRLQCARRVAQQSSEEIAQKLRVLRRLQKRYVECALPRESESRVEQSFNEQLFAVIFGYRTLLSHDRLPYHIRPKNHAKINRRYDDFSLGEFWGDDRDRMLATAEFKDPGFNLDSRQTDRLDKISAVNQAFRAAKGVPTCEWIIVSNFRELRLYQATESSQPVAVFDLHEIRTSKQLAILCAHLDYEALIGKEGKPSMSVATSPQHPSNPISAMEDAFRIIGTFTLKSPDVELPLAHIYDAVHEAASRRLKMRDMSEGRHSAPLPTHMDDGWCSVDGNNKRLAMSTEGQVRLSIRFPRREGRAQINPDAHFWSMAHHMYEFLRVVERAFSFLPKPAEGIVSFELRGIKGWRLYFDGNTDILKKDDDTNSGVSDKDDIFTGDFEWAIGMDDARVAADCMGEIALQFTSHTGARMRFDHKALTAHLDKSHDE